MRLISCLLVVLQAASSLVAATREPGPARVSVDASRLSLQNQVVGEDWRIENGHLRAVHFRDHLNGVVVPLPPSAFTIVFDDGSTLEASDMTVSTKPQVETLTPIPSASRTADQIGGKAIRMPLSSSRVDVEWRLELRDGSNYIRHELTLLGKDRDLPIREVRLLDLRAPNAHVSGAVKGSPVVAGNRFFGFEHPLSSCRVERGRALCSIGRQLPLRPGQRVAYSAVLGTSARGQLRRDFLRYIERERAHAYRTFLHYNSWYDLGYFTKYSEPETLEVIRTFGEELTTKRGVVLNSFLFDDGWDDTSTLWHFHSGFPNGFAPLKDVAAKYDAGPGAWLSPWGGYGKPRDQRIAHGRKEGVEIVDDRYALSGPKYYERFREICFEMLNEYGVNHFKLDGTGNADRVISGSEFDSDFDAAIHLIDELRGQKPDLYVNLTTGTYPSPFWLRYADSIWRGGQDHEFAGVGTDRQRWITYRDADTYSGIVRKGPLFPLSSLMVHGLIYAKHARHLNTDPHGDFDDEVRSYFGNGTQLQEMYISASLLKESDWDVIGESAKWSSANADVLADTHWIGGDPASLQVYGWASWSPRKGIVTLRNPSAEPKTFSLDVGKAFELPPGAATKYVARSPWQKDSARPAIELRAGKPKLIKLAPFEVLTLDAMPTK